MKRSQHSFVYHPLATAALACAVWALPQDAGNTPAPQDSAAPAAPAAPAQGTGEAAVAEDAPSEFGEPVVVNGKRISDLAIKRHLIYGAGQTILNSARIDVLIAMERSLREKGGADPAMLDLPEEVYEKAYERQIESFRRRYPSLDVDTEVGRAYRSPELYERQLRQTLQFDWLFFPPGPPAEWPDVTKEAINEGVMEGQQDPTNFIDLIADAQQNWETRKQAAEERVRAEAEAERKAAAEASGTPYEPDPSAAQEIVFDPTAGEVALRTQYAIEIEPEDEMFMGLLRDYVIRALGSLVETKTASDGLPEELVMTVTGGGVEAAMKTDEIYEQVRPTITDQEIRDTKRFLALMQAAEDKLAAEGFVIPRADFDAEVATIVEQMQNSMFSFDFVALQGYQFPSLEAYKRHLHMLMSFEKKLEPTLANGPDGGISPVLQEHLKVANPIMGLSRVDAEVMLVSAFDFLNNRWKDDGWAWAKKEAERIKADLDGHIEKIQQHEEQRRRAADAGENAPTGEEPPKPFERYWAEMLDLHSDYWDPPMPAEGKAPSMVGMKLKGRFGSQTRNDLERYIGETPFTQFLANDSVTDKIFSEMQIGTIAGPFEGPQGYYIVYLKTRTPATNPLRLNEPRHIDLLRQDYLRREFTRFAHQCLADAGVTGI